MTSISMEDDCDLSMRAPYISMSEADDLPLLISEDLMWGALPESLKKLHHKIGKRAGDNEEGTLSAINKEIPQIRSEMIAPNLLSLLAANNNSAQAAVSVAGGSMAVSESISQRFAGGSSMISGATANGSNKMTIDGEAGDENAQQMIGQIFEINKNCEFVCDEEECGLRGES